MAIKLTIAKTSSSLGIILVASYAKQSNNIEIEWGKELSLQLGYDKTIKCPSTIIRSLARLCALPNFYGSSILERTEVDNWISIAHSAFEVEKTLSYIDSALATGTFIVGNCITAADLTLFALVTNNSKAAKKPLAEFINLNRWTSYIMSFPLVQKTLGEIEAEAKLSVKTTHAGNAGKAPQRKEEGKFIELPGAKEGEVVVRFPPEASGYLHIGHAKAALLNQFYQQKFKGTLIMRFDDTNPAKENSEFERVILEDLEMLQVKYDKLTHTSDHFDLLEQYCEQMLRDGLAYVDDTDPETMKQERDQKLESKNRGNSVEKNMKLWEDMKKGTEHGQTCCVRAKINMQSVNGCMRDPTMYRCKPEPHVRTGYKYKVYPTYDFACPIVDSIEGVTHALRTTEYHDRDEQYYWFLDTLKLRKPFIWEYARLNMVNTVLSKRKLTWFVQHGYVDGWDDPRFPTVRGVLRQGMTVEGLKQFIIAQGSSRSVVQMEWDKIWSFNKKIIDPVAPRYTAVERDSNAEVRIRGVQESSASAALHPKNPDVGSKQMHFSPAAIIDAADVDSLQVGENATFINWGNIRITGINKTNNKVTVDAEPNLENKDYKKTPKITWLPITEKVDLVPCVCVYFDHIISKPVLAKDEDFKNYINKNTKRETFMLGDPDLKNIKKGDIIQLQRKGYFICDSPYQPISMYSSVEAPLILFYIPDGTKSTTTESIKAETGPKTETKNAKQNEPNSSSAQTGLPTDPVILSQHISSLGNKIRALKAAKSEKAQIEPHILELLAAKTAFKSLTGKDWTTSDITTKPGQAVKMSDTTSSSQSTSEADSLNLLVKECGDRVRTLKANKAEKAAIDVAVKELLDLKAKFKKAAGVDWSPNYSSSSGASPAVAQSAVPHTSEKEKKNAKKQDSKPKKALEKLEKEDVAQAGLKKQTRLGLEVKKNENLAEWYSQVITKSEMIEYYDVSGCYILRPWAYGIWESIKDFFDAEIKKLGVKNCYFPIFVSHHALEKEKTHIADFAPEVAWVTKSGSSDLAEPIAIRPTSETVMYPAYAKWIQSHRDLPLKLNQWNNVVRWEFKHPQPFLRTREFLWQEGHTAFASYKEAEEEVYQILDLYRQVYTDLLAIPVIKGRKTEKEKFAGGDFTTTVEAFISASGRGIQGATSHHLGQNFSKMFEIVIEDPETKEKKYVYQNSWGLTTRTIGVMVMVHADDTGLVLPPNVAAVQVVIVPCGINVNVSEEEKNKLIDVCREYEAVLSGQSIRVKGDYRDNYSPGWKFNHWELKGVPIRIELGPRDVKKGEYVAVRRDTGEKLVLKKETLASDISQLLKTIHQDLLQKATKELEDHTVVVTDFKNFIPELDKRNIILAPFCGDGTCEEKIKKESTRDDDSEPGAPAMGAKSLCIPFKQPAEIDDATKCIHPSCTNRPQYYCLFGRSY